MNQWNNIKQLLNKQKMKAMHFCHMFDIDSHSYYSTWAIGEQNTNHHVLWAVNNTIETEEILCIEDFFTDTLFSQIDYDEEHLVVFALIKVVDPNTTAVRIHYKDEVEEVDCISGFVTKKFVRKPRNKPGHRHICYGNLLDEPYYTATGYEFLINNTWEEGVGCLPITKGQTLQLMLQSTEIEELNFYTEKDFPARNYKDLDFREYIWQMRFDIMGQLGTQTTIDLAKQFIVATEKAKKSISEIKRLCKFQDKVNYILFSMFDHFWNEEISSELYKFSKHDQSYFQTLKDAVSNLRDWDWVENDLRRFGLTKTEY